jgi:hypothetical protein
MAYANIEKQRAAERAYRQRKKEERLKAEGREIEIETASFKADNGRKIKGDGMIMHSVYVREDYPRLKVPV